MIGEDLPFSSNVLFDLVSNIEVYKNTDDAYALLGELKNIDGELCNDKTLPPSIQDSRQRGGETRFERISQTQHDRSAYISAIERFRRTAAEH